jgi:hypothetical protein
MNAGGKGGSASSGGAGGTVTGSGGMMNGGGGKGGMGTGSGGGGTGGGTTFQCNAGAGGGGDSCAGGQTFCHLQILRSSPSTATCDSFTDSARMADCSSNPTCACLCNDALFFHCLTDCPCSETGGHVTVTCSQN